MRIFKNALTAIECKELNSIANNYLMNGVLKQGGYVGRFTTRYVSSSFKFDDVVYNLDKKIREIAGICKYEREYPRGKDGINVAVTVNQGGISLHTDPRSNTGCVTYRCNVITQKSNVGGELVIDGEVVNLDIGDLHCYAVSEEPHIVTAVEGSVPRILWMFGCHIPLEEWNYKK